MNEMHKNRIKPSGIAYIYRTKRHENYNHNSIVMYTTSLQCRFLTAIRLPDDTSDIPEEKFEEMLNEYLDQLKAFITTNSYFVVDDTLDSLACLFDELLSSKKKVLSLLN